MRTDEKPAEYLHIDPENIKANPVNVEVYGEEGIDYRLVESIQEIGQLEPLVVVKDKQVPGDYIIISGHRRWMALKQLKQKAYCRVDDLDDELEIKEAIIEYNKQRKKLPSQIVNEANLLRLIFAEKAEIRKKDSLKQNADVLSSAQREEDKIKTGRTRDQVADAVGIGRDKLEKLTKIKKKADEGDNHAKELMKKLDDEELTVNGAYTYLELIETANSEDKVKDYALTLLDSVKRDEITSNKAVDKLNRLRKKINADTQKNNTYKNADNGPYSVLFADFSDRVPLLEDIMQLNIPCLNSSGVLCLLTTTPFVKKSLDIMDWWGFKYKSMCIWEKGTKTSNTWFNGSHELLLLGVGSNWSASDIEKQFPSIIKEKKGHECVHEMIKKMFPCQKYLDIFPKKEHEGWDNWVLEETKRFKELDLKLDSIFDDLDRNESIKMILMGKKKEDGTQDVFEEWY